MKPKIEEWKPSVAELEREHKRIIAEQEKALTEYARKWNDRNAGTRGLTGEARKAALLAFCKRVNTSPRVIEKEPRLWAAKLLSRIADGEVIPPIEEKMAKTAMGAEE